MIDRIPIATRAAAFLAAGGIRAWMSTLDCRAIYYDPSVDAIYTPPPHAKRATRIYVFWHEYILLPLHLRGHCQLTMLLSKHRDADILYRLGHHMGFECVRGSSYRGGASALMELSRVAGDMHVAITPDGPRGPRRELAQGAVFLASRMGLPIVPMGLGYDRPWRLKSWDRFAMPRPFSRARGVVGPEIHIPADLDRAGIETHRVAVERLLNDLTAEAERWAASGERRSGEIVTRRQSRILGPLGVWPGDAQQTASSDEQNAALRLAS
jgi:lysophospholipid acyltransferase (LPLAT)-like uncharacterized protein